MDLDKMSGNTIHAEAQECVYKILWQFIWQLRYFSLSQSRGLANLQTLPSPWAMPLAWKGENEMDDASLSCCYARKCVKCLVSVSAAKWCKDRSCHSSLSPSSLALWSTCQGVRANRCTHLFVLSAIKLLNRVAKLWEQTAPTGIHYWLLFYYWWGNNSM